MLSQFTSLFHSAGRRTLQTALALGLASLAAASSAHALTLDPASVNPGDTFRPEIVGYNQSAPASNIYLINPALAPTFGSTNNYVPNGSTQYALGNQTLTISSQEYISGGLYNDFISISVPTNFVPTGTRDNGGNVINAIQFAIGNYFIPTGGTGDPLDFSQAYNFTVTGTVTFVQNNVVTSGAVPMTTTLTNNGRSLSTFGVVTGTQVNPTNPQGDVSPSQVRGFSILITYAVPEPSTYAAVALGLGCLLLVVRRRARA